MLNNKFNFLAQLEQMPANHSINCIIQINIWKGEGIRLGWWQTSQISFTCKQTIQKIINHYAKGKHGKRYKAMFEFIFRSIMWKGEGIRLGLW